MKRPAHPFATEAELCAAFIAWAQPQGWTAYAETAGWDVLLVGPGDIQIGVQAKLTFNMSVLQQCVLEEYQASSEVGPDFRAILTPMSASGTLLGALGIKGFRYSGDAEQITTRVGWNGSFYPEISGPYSRHQDWFYWNPARRHTLPKYVPDVVAGSAAPIQLTEWKIGALSLVAVSELRGYVTRADFKHYRVDPRRWITEGWVEALPGGLPGEFQVKSDVWRKQHPEVYPQVLADVRDEMASAGRLVLTADEVAR